MNPVFIHNNLKEGDIVRITTPEAVGVIGKISLIDIANDGIVLKEIKETEVLSQIDNPMTYGKALFPISEIKYIFTFDEIINQKNNNEYKI